MAISWVSGFAFEYFLLKCLSLFFLWPNPIYYLNLNFLWHFNTFPLPGWVKCPPSHEISNNLCKIPLVHLPVFDNYQLLCVFRLSPTMSISDVSARLWHQLQPGTLLYLPARLILLLLLPPLQSHRNCLKGTVLGKLSANNERKSVDVFSLSPSHIPHSPCVCLFSLDAQFWEAFYMQYCLRKWRVSLKSKQKGPEPGQDCLQQQHRWASSNWHFLLPCLPQVPQPYKSCTLALPPRNHCVQLIEPGSAF